MFTMQICMFLSIKVLRNSDSRSTSLPCVAWVLQSILAGSDSLFRVSLSTSCYLYARQSRPSLLLSPLALLPVLASLFQPPATSRCVKTGLRFCLIHYLCCEFWLLYFNLLLPLVASKQACVCMRVCVCVCVCVCVGVRACTVWTNRATCVWNSVGTATRGRARARIPRFCVLTYHACARNLTRSC
jgi:hypothetical protein